MKSFKKYLYLPMALLALVGCNNDDAENNLLGGGEDVLIATVADNASTRVTIVDGSTTNQKSLRWTEGDEIMVFGDNNASALYKLQKGEGETTAKFKNTGDAITGHSLAVFPGANASIEGTTTKITLLAEYDASELTNLCNLPMKGSVVDKTVKFSFLTGVLRLKMSSLPENTMAVTLTADKQIAGKFAVTTNQSNEEVVAAVEGTDANTIADNDKKVTLNIDTESTKNMTVYFPLPVGDYSDLKLTLTVKENENTTKEVDYAVLADATKKRTVARGKIYTAERKYEVPANSLLQEVAGVKDDTYSTEVTGQFEAEANKPVAIPDAVENFEVNFVQQPVTSDQAPLAFQSGTTASNKPSEAASKEYTVGLPATEENNPIEAMNVDAYDATFNLVSNDANGGVTEITNMGVKAAIGTFIVGRNVHIGTLTVNGGTIYIKEGAKVEAITKNTALSKVFVYDENGTKAWQNADGTDKTNVLAAESREAAILRYVAANGGMKTVQLTEALKLNTPILVGTEMTLDLNGQSITPVESGFVINPGTDAISNQALIYVRRGAKLTVTDSSTEKTGAINSGSVYSAIAVTEASDETNTQLSGKTASLIVNGGTITGLYYGITGNGARHNTSIEINEGAKLVGTATKTIESNTVGDGYGLFHPQNGTLTINGGTLEGTACGLELRAGTLNVTGGTFTNTIEQFYKGANGSGSTLSGAGIAISQHTTEKDINVTISGATLSGAYAFYEEDLQQEEGSIKNSKIALNAATYNGGIYSENFTKFITAGDFTHLSALHYTADNAEVTVNVAEDFTSGEVFTIGKKATIDLGSKNVEVKNIIAGIGTASSDLTIKNGTLKTTATTVTEDGKKVGVAGIQLDTAGSKLTLENVSFTSGRTAIKVLNNQIVNGNCTVTITGSSITTGEGGTGILLNGKGDKLTMTDSNITHKYMGITQNGNNPGATINVSGGSITGTYTGIYLSNKEGGDYNTLTVDGCAINSKQESAIEVKKTDITVTNSTLKSEASPQAFTFSAGGSGGVGYGIVLATYEEGREYEGYDEDTYADLEALITELEKNTFELAVGSEGVKVYKCGPKPIRTAEELLECLTNFTDNGSGNSAIEIVRDIILDSGQNWTPAKIDGYNGAGVITINGNGHKISGLTAPLLAGGFAGNSGVVINDLILENSTINDNDNDQGIGAFIGCIDSMPIITLNKCTLRNSTIVSTAGARVGGLIGWTAGYNNENDGAVDTYITITDCTVENCNITAAGSVGGIIGHAGNNPATYHTITNCTVSGCTLISNDDSYRVGAIVGTANVGKVTISGCTSENNTYKQNNKGTEITRPAGQSDLYGRFVPGETGELTIDGTEITK